METRTLGTEGLEVAAIGLGCMGMSEFYGPGDAQESVATIRRFIALCDGAAMLDTADMYGQGSNEELVGEAISGRRDEVVIATKFGIVRDRDNPRGRGVNGRPDYVHASCDASLRRLQVDHIDLYYQHRVDPDVPVEETVGAMAELVDAGKVRYIGLSEAAPERISRAAAVHPIAALQFEYSLWTRDVEAEHLELLRSLGIGLVAYSPLGRGFLTGTITSTDVLADDDFRRNNPRFADGNLERNLRLVETVREIAHEHGATPGQVALAWVLSRGPDVVPIPGTKRLRYLEENVEAAELELDTADLAVLDELAPAVGDRYADMSRVNL
jgi:aryl-alcohol dehydrogenase-like predicted oxidoreductase